MSGADDREILTAAEEALSRVMTGVADQVERMPPDLEPADVLRWAGDRATELLAGFAELPLDRLLGLGGRSPGRPADAAPPTGEPLSVRVDAGAVAEARVWVHAVSSGGSDGVLHLSLGSLTGPDGAPWVAADVIFTPAACVLPIAGPWSTVLRFRVPDDAPRGPHHGLVIARGSADAAVPITVVIT